MITQETGFGDVLPVGNGLLSFSDPDEALSAIEAVTCDPSRHSRAAREVAEECFGAERVLRRVLDTVGVL